MENRIILPIKLLLLIPFILFTFIYSKQYIQLLLISFVIIISYKHFFKLLPLYLITIFFSYSFYNLGATYIPKSYHLYKKNQIINLELNNSSDLDKICYFYGINRNLKLNIEIKKNAKWQKVLETNPNVLSFQWQCKKINIKNVKNMRFISKKGFAELRELRLFHKNTLIPYFTLNNKINDEQYIKTTKKYLYNMIFDETYVPLTSYEIINGIYPLYENTHPLLGEQIIAISIKLFGMNPFGWRFASVIFGAFFIIVIYYFSLYLFNNTLYAFTSAYLMLYSFMHFTLSRVGLIDTFGAFFTLCSFWLLLIFIKKQKLIWLFLSSVFYGLASSVKWVAALSALGYIAIAIYLILSHYPLRKKFQKYKLIAYGILNYALVSPIIYLLSFFYIYIHSNFTSIIKYQINMFNYHKNLSATHPYSSPWWSWPLDIKPLCTYRNIQGDVFSSITIFGNPAIFWISIVSLIYLFYSFTKKANIEKAIIIFGFISLYLPYIFVNRIMFIYHYYYAIPFVILAIVYSIKEFLSKYNKLYILWGYLTLNTSLFLMFYPVLSGYEVNQNYIRTYLKWLSSWWL